MEAALRALDGRARAHPGHRRRRQRRRGRPVPALADLAERYGAWLHVDGAFGLFARLSPRTAHLAEGVERADSVIADGHKWLNVPYDTGFAFVAEPELLARVFSMDAAYSRAPTIPTRTSAISGLEASRRARGIPVWATLEAYGRQGYRALVERHLDLTERLAARVRAEPDLELLSEPVLNVVAFRVRPPASTAAELDDLNRAVGADLIEDGRVYAGTTTYRGVAAFRPAIAGWRITEREVDLLVDVIVELARAAALTAATADGSSRADRSPGSRPSQAARMTRRMTLPGARLGQRRDDRHDLGLERLAQLGRDPPRRSSARSAGRRPRCPVAATHEDDDRLALDLVRDADGGGLEDRRMRDGRALDLGRPDPLAGDLERVVGAAVDEPEAVRVDRWPSRRGPRCPGQRDQ